MAIEGLFGFLRPLVGRVDLSRRDVITRTTVHQSGRSRYYGGRGSYKEHLLDQCDWLLEWRHTNIRSENNSLDDR